MTAIGVRRVHVVGGSGAGKTTLAHRLGACLDAPVHDLDAVACQGGPGRKRTLGERLADASRTAGESGWVTEGPFLWWTEELLRSADLVVWLDPAWRTAARRSVLRHVRADLAGRNPHHGYGKLFRSLRGTRGYYRARAPANHPRPTTMVRSPVPLPDSTSRLTVTSWSSAAESDADALLRRLCRAADPQ